MVRDMISKAKQWIIGLWREIVKEDIMPAGHGGHAIPTITQSTDEDIKREVEERAHHIVSARAAGRAFLQDLLVLFEKHNVQGISATFTRTRPAIQVVLQRDGEDFHFEQFQFRNGNCVMLMPDGKEISGS